MTAPQFIDAAKMFPQLFANGQLINAQQAFPGLGSMPGAASSGGQLLNASTAFPGLGAVPDAGGGAAAARYFPQAAIPRAGAATAAATAPTLAGAAPGAVAGAEGAAGLTGMAKYLTPKTMGGQFGRVPLALAGLTAGSVANSAGAPSILSNALAGAGIGAAVGGPWGAGIGAGVGVVQDIAGIDILGYGKKTDPAAGSADMMKAANKIIKNVGGRIAQLDPTAAAGIRAQLKVAKLIPPGQERDAYIMQIAQQIPAQLVAAKEKRSQVKDQMLLQQMTGALMAQLGESQVQSGQAQASAIRAMAPNLPPSYQPIAEIDAVTREQRARQMANAFTGSVIAQPVFEQYQSQISQLAQLNQQQFAQTGQSGSLQQLLAAGG